MLSLIVTHSRNRVIGFNSELPWHLPEVQQFINKVTTKNTIIMGRKTFDTIGRPLPNRRTIVLSRDRSFRKRRGVEVVRNINLLKLCKKQPGEYFFIGGEEVFKQAISLVDKMYVIYIDEVFDGDAFFPEFNESEWELVSQIKGTKDKNNPYDYYFRTYVRTRGSK